MNTPLQSAATIPAPRASGYTSTTSAPLYWAAYGPAGVDPLLVLHGGPGAHHDYLLPQMLVLAQKRELIFYDQRGGGQSRDESRETITWRTHVDDLSAVIGEFGLKPATIVGYSWGGLLAMLHATSSLPVTEMTGRLILIDPAPANRTFRQEFEAEFSRRQAATPISEMREDLAQSGLRETDPPAYRKRLFEIGVAGYFADPAAASGLTPFRVTGKVQQSVWASLADYDLVPALRGITCPAMVVHGRDDPIPVQSSLQVAEALSARLLLLEKCGHVPYVEQPDALFSAIERFLDRYPVAQRSDR